MELPTEYLRQTLELLEPLCAAKGSIGVKHVQSALGKAARIGYILPDVSPFISSLWGGFRAGRMQAAEEKQGASKHRLPIRRFSVAAKWFCTMLREALNQEDFGAAALRRIMNKNRSKLFCPDLPVITFDASPWGGGGILWRQGKPVQYTHFRWSSLTLQITKTVSGDCRGQTAFEFLTLFLVAVVFGSVLQTSGALIRGDNLSALNVALNLNSTSTAMNAIAREVAWRRIVLGWQYRLRHLPAEKNDEADALSRLHAVPSRAFPSKELQGAEYVMPPAQNVGLWKARLVL